MHSSHPNLKNLKPGSHIHLMGICGTAMASLAGILKEMGFRITGSDQNVYPPMSTQLEKLGIKIMEGYKRENLLPKPDLVIVGNVITRKFDETQALLESDIPYTSLPQALGEFVIARRDCIVISGTHGKTTTTSLMAWVADRCGEHPGFLVGGIPVNFDKSFQVPSGNLFVIEGDEYDTAFFDKVPKFIHYKPKFAILTSVEFDHADIYRDLDHVKDAFRMLLDRIPENGFLMACADDEGVRSLTEAKRSYPIFTYGESNAQYTFQNIQLTAEACSFDIHYEGKKLVSISTPLFGRYNLANITAVVATAHQRGWDLAKVKEALSTFKGVKRRQEIIGKPNGITVIEDFAHHPTAVNLTLGAIRERFKKHKIFAAFEPRSATSRRKVFQKAYVEAFKEADVTLISEAYNVQALDAENRFSSEELVQEIRDRYGDKHEALSFKSVDEIVLAVKERAKPGDVVVIMSNGAFGGIYQKMLAAL